MLRHLLLFLVAVTTFAQRAPIAPREIAPVPYSITSAVTAFAGDRFLTVWPHTTLGTGTVFAAAFSDASGTRISPAAFAIDLAPGERSRIVQLVSLGNAYALFWHDRSANVHLTELDLEGNVIRDVLVPYKPVSYLPLETYAWNGTHFLAVFKNNRDYVEFTDGVLFDREGTLVKRFALERINDQRVAIADGDGFVVVMTGRIGVAVQRVDASGGVTPVKFFSAVANSGVAAGAGDGDVLLAWSDRAGEVITARLTPELEIRTRTELPRTVISAAFPLHIARVNDGFRLVVNAQGLYAIDLDDDGRARGDFRMISQEPYTRYTTASIASNDRVTLVVSSGCEYCAPIQSVRAVSLSDVASEPEVLSLAPTRQSDPLITAIGGRFLASWIDSSADGTVARTAVVLPNGATTATNTIAAGVRSAADKLAWNDSEAMLLVGRGHQLAAIRIAPDGRALDAQPFTIATLADPDRAPLEKVFASVAWIGDRWLVAWVQGESIFTAEVDASGYAREPRRFEPRLPAPKFKRNIEHTASLGWNGRDVLLVFQHEQRRTDCFEYCEGKRVVYAALLDEYGQPRTTPVAIEEPAVRPESQEVIASSGDEFFVLRGATAIIVRTDGGVPFAHQQPPLINYPSKIEGDVTWDGEEYVVALRYASAGSHLALLRFDRNGIATTRARHTNVNRGDQPVVSRPSIAAQSGIGALIAVHEAAGGADTARVTVIRELELAPLGDVPARPRVHAQPVGYPNWKKIVSWQPQPDAEGYLVEVGYNGGWFRVYDVPATTTSVTVFTSQSVRVFAYNSAGISAPAQPSFEQPRRRSSSGN